jgi:LuxR family maltose regulon positive regulatory protein
MALLGRLAYAAEHGERHGSLISILIHQALAWEALNDLSAALAPLGHALSLAEPEGYVRIFIDEGSPMLRLLTEAQSRGLNTAYIERLCSALTPPGRAGSAVTSHMLSEREIEVLQLVARGLSNREIGEQLYLALDTVKGHNRRIFGKLGVQHRTEAVARAREMNLIKM